MAGAVASFVPGTFQLFDQERPEEDVYTFEHTKTLPTTFDQNPNYNLRQHDMHWHCVSVNVYVFLWGPIQNLVCLSVLEHTACHVGQHFFW